jgi:hypothetical protein
LPEFSLFEEGLVNTLAIHVANRHEIDFMQNNSEYRADTRSEVLLAGGPLTRNTMAVIATLNGILTIKISGIMENGEHLG